MKTHTKTLLATLTASAMIAGSAGAALVTSHVSGHAGLSSTDLLTGLTPTTNLGSAGYTATGAMNNGTATGANADLLWVRNPGFIQYILDTSVNTAGYDITDLVIFTDFGTGFSNFNNMTVSTRKIGGSFASAGTITSNLSAADAKLAISNFGTAGTGIDGIRLDFASGGVMMAEIDLNGSPVPEPGSLALLGLGGLLIASRRRRG